MWNNYRTKAMASTFSLEMDCAPPHRAGASKTFMAPSWRWRAGPSTHAGEDLLQEVLPPTRSPPPPNRSSWVQPVVAAARGFGKSIGSKVTLKCVSLMGKRALTRSASALFANISTGGQVSSTCRLLDSIGYSSQTVQSVVFTADDFQFRNDFLARDQPLDRATEATSSGNVPPPSKDHEAFFRSARTASWGALRVGTCVPTIFALQAPSCDTPCSARSTPPIHASNHSSRVGQG